MVTRARKLSPQTLSVLQALASAAGDWSYGLEIAAATGLRSGSLYPILVRLAERGLLESCWLPPQRPGRPPRHAYKITALGRAALREACRPQQQPREALAR